MRIRKKGAMLIIVAMIVIGLVAPFITPYNPNDFSFEPLLTPSFHNLLGTSYLGQDIFSGLLFGFRISIVVALSSAVISTALGTVLAIAKVYYGGIIEVVISKATDLFLIVPEIVMIMVFAIFSGPGIHNTIFVISFFSWSRVTRIVSSKAKVVMEYDSIQYTLLLKGGIIDVLKKMWYDIQPSVATMFILQCSKAIMYESNLAFMGIGDPTIKSWGRMIRQGIDFEGIFSNSLYIWWLIPPVLCIVLFVSALSLLSFEVEKSSDKEKYVLEISGYDS